MLESEDWLKRLHSVVGRSFGRPHDPQAGPVWSHGEGCWLVDSTGKRYLDFRCGYSAANFGHAPAKLIAVAQQQLGRLTQLTQLPSIELIECAEKVLDFLELRGSSKVHFNVGGARAIESALKIALRRKPGAIICFTSGYHGRSIATQPLSDSVMFAETLPWPGMWRGDVVKLPYPTGASLSLQPASWQGVLEQFEVAIKCRINSLSAVLVEPMLGARGYIAPPDVFFQRLQRLASQAGGLLIADEIQVGLGRGGGRLLSRLQGWEADLVVLGKSLGGGLVPISAVVGSRELIDSLPTGSESETFAGSPLACAVAQAALEELRLLEPGLDLLGAKLQQAMRKVVDEFTLPIRVERHGMSITLNWIQAWPTLSVANGVDFVADVSRCVAKVAKYCLDEGLLLHPSGPAGTRLVLIPPLVVTYEEIAQATEKMQAALRRLAAA